MCASCVFRRRPRSTANRSRADHRARTDPRGHQSVRPNEAPHRRHAPRRRRPAAGGSSSSDTSTRSVPMPSRRIGEDPVGVPNNSIRTSCRWPSGGRHLTVFSNDYPTADGTAVRDYLHVVDLAEGHLAALERIDQSTAPEPSTSVRARDSVLEVVHAAASRPVARSVTRSDHRRAGDVVAAWANVDLRGDVARLAPRHPPRSRTCAPITGAGSPSIRTAIRRHDTTARSVAKNFRSHPPDLRGGVPSHAQAGRVLPYERLRTRGERWSSRRCRRCSRTA